MKKSLLIGGVVLIGTVMIGYLAVLRPLYHVDQRAENAVRRLIVSNTIGVANINYSAIRAAKRLNSDDIPIELPLVDDMFTSLQLLKRCDPNWSERVQFVLSTLQVAEKVSDGNGGDAVGGAPEQKQTTDSATAVVGDFLDTIWTCIESQPGATSRDENGVQVVNVRLQDLDTCKESEPVDLFMLEEVLYVSDPSISDSLIASRDEAGNQNNATTETWRAYSEDKVLSVGLLSPVENLATLGMGFLGRIAAAPIKLLTGFDSLFVGAQVSLTDLGLKLSAWAPGLRVPAGRIKEWQADLAKKAIEPSTPEWMRDSLAALTLSQSNEGFAALMHLPDGATKELAGFPGNLLSSAFTAGGGDDVVAERIDKDAMKFESSLPDSYALPAPKKETRWNRQKGWTVIGPALVSLSEVRQTTSGDIELHVTATRGEVANLAGDSSLAMFYVDDVLGHGRSLLRNETCGDYRASIGVALKASPFTNNKVVRLKRAVRHRDVERVMGHIEIKLPMRTESVLTRSPKAGMFVERNGARLTIDDVKNSRFAYRLDDPHQRVLSIRATNEKGQVLSNSSSWGSREGKTQTVAGKVVAIKVVFATEFREERLPFSLRILRPPGGGVEPDVDVFETTLGALSEKMRGLSPPEVKQRFGTDALATQVVGPIRASLTRLDDFWGLTPKINISAGSVDPLTGTLGNLTVAINAVVMADGQRLDEPTDADFEEKDNFGRPKNIKLPPRQEKPVWRQNASLQFNQWEKRLSSAPLDFHTGLIGKKEDVSAIDADLILRVPQNVDVLPFGTVYVGETIEKNDFLATLIAIKQASFSVRLDEGADKLLAVLAFDGNEAQMPTTPESPLIRDNGNTLTFRTAKKPAYVTLLTSDRWQEKSYPLSFRLNRTNP